MKEIELSDEIFNLVKNNILLKSRFLEIMIYRLNIHPIYIIPFGTDGVNIYYNPYFLIEYFKQNKVNTSRLYLHSCFHALLLNPFNSHLKDDAFWDVACDICVEHIIDEFDIETYNRDGQAKRNAVIEQIKQEVPYIQPEFVYNYLKNNPNQLESLKMMFELDDHTAWKGRTNSNCNNGEEGDGDGEEGDSSGDFNSSNSSSSQSSGESGDSQDNAQGSGSSDGESNEQSDAQSSSGGSNGDYEQESNALSEQVWTEISNKLMIEISHFSKEIGVNAGSLFSQLNAVTKEKYDYEAFLKKFAILQETPKLNMDEFDMIFYKFGLDTYGNMPLIEPLEYKDDYLVKDFVIAIDTSGSVQGEVVNRFLTKTYNILETTNSFGKTFNLHIIQCDTKIQHAVKITNKKEFDEYIARGELYGFGGTDFRPVFTYVEEMIRSKQFTKLKGLIYFTDGYGEFPVKKTPYETCFVFVDKMDYDSVTVPVWSKKIFLETEEI